jgi:hypothetical protein
MSRYQEFERFVHSINSNRSKSEVSRLDYDFDTDDASFAIASLDDDDDWWLAELGFGKRLIETFSGLSAIAEDIEARVRKSGSIIDEVIPI